MTIPLSELIHEFGLSQYSEQIQQLAMPSIRILTTPAADEDIPLGTSKLGGLPHLPADVAWPEKKGLALTFLAQFNLSELAPYDVDKVLPYSGMVYFFYDAETQPWGYDPHNRGSWKVLHEDSALLTRSSLHSFESNPFRVCRVNFSREITLPPFSCEPILGADRKVQFRYRAFACNLVLDEEGFISYLALQKHLESYVGSSYIKHRLLGYPNPVQNDMEEECQLASHGIYCGKGVDRNSPEVLSLLPSATDWRLLLQLDTEEEYIGWNWGLSGRIYFWIQQQALKIKDFDNTWLVLQCT